MVSLLRSFIFSYFFAESVGFLNVAIQVSFSQFLEFMTDCGMEKKERARDFFTIGIGFSIACCKQILKQIGNNKLPVFNAQEVIRKVLQFIISLVLGFNTSRSEIKVLVK